MASKGDLIECVANNADLTKRAAAAAVEAVFDCFAKSLADGDRVQVAGFGTFQISERKERQGRNPQTGAPMTIKASKNVRFKAGKALKDSVN